MDLLAQILAQGVGNPIIGSGFNIGGWNYASKVLSSFVSIGFLIATVVFVFIFIVGSFQWITAGGDKGKLAEARGKITHAIVGLLVLLLVFLISQLINLLLGINIGNLGTPLPGEEVPPGSIVATPTPGGVVPPGSSSPTPTPGSFVVSCVDSDGSAPYTPGTVTVTQTTTSYYNDYCVDGSTAVMEQYCEGSNLAEYRAPCSKGCLLDPNGRGYCMWDIVPIETSPVIPSPTPTLAACLSPASCQYSPCPAGNQSIPNTICQNLYMTCCLPLTTPTSTPTRIPTATPTRIPTATPTPYCTTTLTVNPSSGTVPLPVSFTASVAGTATGTIQCQYDCTNNGSYEYVVNSFSSPCPASVCLFTSTGSYTGRVHVTRQGVTCDDTAGPIVVGVPNTPTPTPTPSLPAPFCIDSDFGQVYTTYGYASGVNSVGEFYSEADYCVNSTLLSESYCQSVTALRQDYSCNNMGPYYVCLAGKCCVTAGGNCSLDGDCCLGNICNAGKCQAATNIILNQAEGRSCHDLCYVNGFQTSPYCRSIGTNTIQIGSIPPYADNGVYVNNCVYNQVSYSCDHGILSSVSFPLCNGYQTNWTYCNCVPN